MRQALREDRLTTWLGMVYLRLDIGPYIRIANGYFHELMACESAEAWATLPARLAAADRGAALLRTFDELRSLLRQAVQTGEECAPTAVAAARHRGEQQATGDSRAWARRLARSPHAPAHHYTTTWGRGKE